MRTAHCAYPLLLLLLDILKTVLLISKKLLETSDWILWKIFSFYLQKTSSIDPSLEQKSYTSAKLTQYFEMALLESRPGPQSSNSQIKSGNHRTICSNFEFLGHRQSFLSETWKFELLLFIWLPAHLDLKNILQSPCIWLCGLFLGLPLGRSLFVNHVIISACVNKILLSGLEVKSFIMRNKKIPF